ncbi:MFS transporter [Microbispora sp. H11081]|uniref:MFS transporter n=1 Tax=Microbispora sp. H11081 TaxID=2729107 RepID=UPI001475272E|nr:MFS transporter [Microbispora sp. H11081]
MQVTSPLRLARAAAFTAVCLGLGVLAHLFGGGAVAPDALALGLPGVFAAALPLSGRERTLRSILPLLAVLQVALHVLFALSSPLSPAPLSPAPALGVVAGHPHAGPGLGMLIAHGWAVVLTSLWLARGEAALWALLRRLAVRLTRIARDPAPPVRTPPASPHPAEPRVPRSVAPRHCVTRRGPPRLLLPSR